MRSLDVLFGDIGGVDLWQNFGSGNFTRHFDTIGMGFWGQDQNPLYHTVRAIAFADVDGDYRLDVVLGRGRAGNAQANVIFRNVGEYNNFSFAEVRGTSISTAMTDTTDVAFGDYDGDGALRGSKPRALPTPLALADAGSSSACQAGSMCS